MKKKSKRFFFITRYDMRLMMKLLLMLFTKGGEGFFFFFGKRGHSLVDTLPLLFLFFCFMFGGCDAFFSFAAPIYIPY